MNQAEDGSVRADPERQRGDGRESESRAFPQCSKRQPQVGDHGKPPVKRRGDRERAKKSGATNCASQGVHPTNVPALRL
jgi:hypothetical protein